MPLQPFQERVLVERAELEIKLSNLKSFIGNPTFEDLPMDERLRLSRQRRIMENYVEVLSERIAAFPA